MQPEAARPPDRGPVAQPHRGRTRQGSEVGETGAPPGAGQEQQEGIAYILEDPEKLRELREQLKKRERKAAKQHKRSRGLHI